MFSTDEAPAQGVSAVKALAIASAEGQKIWTIGQNNLDLALEVINLSVEVENEIRSAVNAGNIATAHEAQIVFGGWVGSGYLLIDPETGAGAYKIAGGGNGSVIEVLISLLPSILSLSVDFKSGISNISTILFETVKGLLSGDSWGVIAVKVIAALIVAYLLSFIIIGLLVDVGVSLGAAKGVAITVGAMAGIFSTLQWLGVVN